MKQRKLSLVSRYEPDNLKLKDIRLLPPHIIEPRDLKGFKCLQQIVEEVQIDNKTLKYLTPSMIGIQLNIAQINLDNFSERKKEIKELASNQNLKSKNGGESLFNESLYFYELIECAYQSIIFSFTALETFINISIPDDFIWVKKGNKKTEIYDKKQIERYVSWKDKLNIIIKDIYKSEEVKKESFWNDLFQLEDIRNRLIHMKSADDTAVIQTIMHTNLTKICNSSEKFIAYIYSKAFKNNRLHKNLSKFPYLKSLEVMYVLGKEVDEIEPLVTYEEFLEQFNE